LAASNKKSVFFPLRFFTPLHPTGLQTKKNQRGKQQKMYPEGKIKKMNKHWKIG